jgi:hypothetical protein
LLSAVAKFTIKVQNTPRLLELRSGGLGFC